MVARIDRLLGAEMISRRKKRVLKQKWKEIAPLVMHVMSMSMMDVTNSYG
jgi:hypothetical protein